MGIPASNGSRDFEALTNERRQQVLLGGTKPNLRGMRRKRRQTANHWQKDPEQQFGNLQ